MLPAQVVVRYKGTHKGKVFDETKGKATFSFRLGALPKITISHVLHTLWSCLARQCMQAYCNFGSRGVHAAAGGAWHALRLCSMHVLCLCAQRPDRVCQEASSCLGFRWCANPDINKR